MLLKPRLPQFLMRCTSSLLIVSQLCRQIFTLPDRRNPLTNFLQTIAHRDEANLLRFIEANPVLLIGESDETEVVQTVACQIHRGVIPALTDLAQVFPADPETPQARHLLNRFTYFLNQAGTLGEMRGEQLRLALGLRSRKYMLRHLENLTQRYETHTSNNRQISEHHHYLCQLIKETERALIPLLADDPSVGKSIHLNAQKQAYPNWLQKVLRWQEKLKQLSVFQLSADEQHYAT